MYGTNAADNNSIDEHQHQHQHHHSDDDEPGELDQIVSSKSFEPESNFNNYIFPNSNSDGREHQQGYSAVVLSEKNTLVSGTHIVESSELVVEVDQKISVITGNHEALNRELSAICSRSSRCVLWFSETVLLTPR